MGPHGARREWATEQQIVAADLLCHEVPAAQHRGSLFSESPARDRCSAPVPCSASSELSYLTRNSRHLLILSPCLALPQLECPPHVISVDF